MPPIPLRGEGGKCCATDFGWHDCSLSILTYYHSNPGIFLMLSQSSGYTLNIVRWFNHPYWSLTGFTCTLSSMSAHRRCSHSRKVALLMEGIIDRRCRLEYSFLSGTLHQRYWPYFQICHIWKVNTEYVQQILHDCVLSVWRLANGRLERP